VLKARRAKHDDVGAVAAEAEVERAHVGEVLREIGLGVEVERAERQVAEELAAVGRAVLHRAVRLREAEPGGNPTHTDHAARVEVHHHARGARGDE